MRACLVVCVVVALVGAASAECGACIDGLCYKKHRLANISGTLLDIDRNINTIYVKSSTISEVVMKCDLDTTTCTNIIFSVDVAVDQRTSDVYALDIRSGIFRYRADRNNQDDRTLISGEAKNIAFKDEIYLSPLNFHGLYTLEIVSASPFSIHKVTVPGTDNYKTKYFIIDKNNDIYFEDITVYRKPVIRRLSKGVVNETEAWDSNYRITVDRDGNAVFIHPETRTVYRVTNGQLVEVGAVEDSVYGRPAFDGDNNLVYQTNLDEFYHLKREGNLQCIISTTADNKRTIYQRS